MQQSDMTGVQIALKSLRPVTLVKSFGCEFMTVGQMRPFELRDGWRLIRAHIGPDGTSKFPAGIAYLFYSPRCIAFGGLVWLLHTIAGNVEFPPVVHAAQPMFLVTRIKERSASVWTMQRQEPHVACGVAERN